MRSALLVLFLLVQVALPARYYLGLSSPFDPRFAWRMFSPLHLTRCGVEFSAHTEASRTIDPSDHIHSAAVYFMHLGRPHFAERFAATWCASRRRPDPDLRVELVCSEPAHLDRVLCRSGWQSQVELMGAYEREWKYRSLAPEEAYALECGDLDPRTCAREICNAVLHDGRDNLCE